jgi:hypothetical protein
MFRRFLAYGAQREATMVKKVCRSVASSRERGKTRRYAPRDSGSRDAPTTIGIVGLRRDVESVWKNPADFRSRDVNEIRRFWRRFYRMEIKLFFRTAKAIIRRYHSRKVQ